MRRDVPALVGAVALAFGCNAGVRPDSDAGVDQDAADAHEADAATEDAGDLGESTSDADAAPDGPPEADADLGESDVVWWTPTTDCDARSADPPAWVAPPCGAGCRQVATAADPYGQFAASERWLAYQSWWHTWVVDLTTGAETILFCHPEFLGSYGLGISANGAAYALNTHFPAEGREVDYAALWATDLDTGRQWAAAEWVKPYDSGNTDLFALAVSGRYAALGIDDIVGTDPGSRHGDIYSINLDTRIVNRVSDLGWPCCFGWPDIGGNWVVYTTIAAVFAYDIEHGITIGPEIPGDQWWPRTDGGRMVWLDHRNYPGGYGRGGSWDIYAYDLTLETELRITTTVPVREKAAPDILDDVVVWSDGRFATAEEPHHSDLFMYRFSTGREEQITFASGAARWPKLTADAVYFNWVPSPEPDPDTANHALCAQTVPPP
jgi:hypothetical protein